MPARPAPFAALLLLRDVTDERRLQRRLVLGERMAAVGQLAAGLAHEINNPVSAAYSNLQLATDLLLRHKDVLPPSLADLFEMLEDCRVGMSRVRDIVRDLRDFTSTEVKSAAGEVRLDDIIDLGLRLSRSQVQRRARLIYDRDLSPMPLIRGDAGKLSHMLMNLISQALHNLPTSADPARRRQAITVRTRIDRAGGQVELVVADTGPTLSEQIRAHLFEPFAQRRERLPAAVSAALGMGLAVSYEVVQRHGGDIEARPGPPGDEPGCGNQLIVRLPFSRSEDLGNSGPALVQGARLRLLFIDEDPGQQRAYKEQVGDLHEVVTASSAKEALSLFDAGETFDVVFCNLSLVAGSGVGLHREVAARDAALAGRFVFVGSGPPEGRSYVEMLHLHCIDGPDRAALLSAVAAVMHPHPG
jgi:signal transduction histidine kinase